MATPRRIQLYQLTEDTFVLTLDGVHYQFPRVDRGWDRREPYSGDPEKEKLLPLTTRASMGTGAPRSWVAKPRNPPPPDARIEIKFRGARDLILHDKIVQRAIRLGKPTSSMIKEIMENVCKTDKE